MKDIQLDMFEVQLGAAILLQFRTEESIVRVLADAGILASNYHLDHVHKKLHPVINDFDKGASVIRLDLIIGTHYDADHLEGLVPIINDESIEIGEAWMPPVANDTLITTENASIQNHQLLVYQFGQSDAEKRLFEYLKSKQNICQEVEDLQNIAHDFLNKKQSNKRRELENYSQSNDLSFSKYVEDDLKPDRYSDYFKLILQESDLEGGHTGCSHSDLEFDDEDFLTTDYSRQWHHYGRGFADSRRRRVEFFNQKWHENESFIEYDIASLAYIKRGAARDAITATSLYKVVQALKRRNVPTICQTIFDGESRRFIWTEIDKRFIPRARVTSGAPELLLLGPSKGLVKKHQSRLPIGEYMMFITSRSIPIKNITPSNQLSYVIKFEYKKQGILITGDAGFVDFKPKGKSPYYANLIDKLTPLHLIQIAHHGGRNAHFYRVLLDSKYPEQTDKSLLLLSHATLDKLRPSDEFGYFVENLLKDEDNVRLLFTSKPRLERVRDFKGLIYPPTITPTEEVGDVQVIFDGQKWNVLKHAIAV